MVHFFADHLTSCLVGMVSYATGWRTATSCLGKECGRGELNPRISTRLVTNKAKQRVRTGGTKVIEETEPYPCYVLKRHKTTFHYTKPVLCLSRKLNVQEPMKD
jgi:hypothetical protein